MTEKHDRSTEPEAGTEAGSKGGCGCLLSVVVAIGIGIVVFAGGGDDESPKPNAPAPRESAQPDLSARQRLDDALSELDARVSGETPGTSIAVTAQTPEGGLDGASTGDLNRQAARIFRAIHGTAGYRRASVVEFQGGLVDSRTGEDIPDARTGLYRLSREEAAAIIWSDEERVVFNIDWTLYREFAHPALKQDDD